jgi:glycosyltransferase involved in cell wall biosynthesis
MTTAPSRRPRLLVLYHFLHPDPVVSARIFSDFAAEQAARGWDVTALTSNRWHGEPDGRLPTEERWNGVRIRRVFRPPWSQKKPLPRLGNSAWLLPAWFAESARLGAFDAIVIGSDPSFAASIAIPLRAARPHTPIIHWCFDVFPDAVEAEWTGRTRLLAPPARALMSAAYRRCDVVVDLGPCMRERLERYGEVPRRETFTPWALVEPEQPPEPDPAARRALFGDAKLGLLYGGSMGRAHDYEGLLALARACRARAGDEIVMCFACTGTNRHRLEAARRPEDTNVRFAPFAEEETIGERFAAADFHLGSLRPDYTGVVVPSKFFAALAAARPFIFAGEDRAAIARWIREHDVGIVLTPGRADEVAERLVSFKDDPSAVRAMRANALATYRRHFSRRHINDRWAALLESELARKSSRPI